MAEFDPERYLRLLGERVLLGPGRQGDPWSSPLSDAADCLVAAGTIELDRAQRIVDDYELAKALRSEGHGLHFLRRHRWAAAQPDEEAKPPRVAPCGRTITTDVGSIDVHHISLGEDATSVAITFRPADPPSARRRRAGMVMWGSGAFHHAPPGVTLRDDRGNESPATFNGGGSDDEWEGEFVADDPLAPGTAWIEIEGQRIELAGDTPLACVRIEDVEDESPGLRHLWHGLAAADRHFREPSATLEAGIEALVAAGELNPNGDQVAQLRAVASALSGPGLRHAGGSTRRAELAEPWRSLLRNRRAHRGATGRIPVAALTPAFDGLSVAVSYVEADEDSFGAHVHVSGGGLPQGSIEGMELGARRVAWWARDDVGNHYLGGLGDWNGSEHHMRGTVQFDAPLDSRARWLELLPTTTRRRAVIRIGLEGLAPPESNSGR